MLRSLGLKVGSNPLNSDDEFNKRWVTWQHVPLPPCVGSSQARGCCAEALIFQIGVHMWFVVGMQAPFVVLGWILTILPPHTLPIDLFVVTLAVVSTFCLVESIGDALP